MDERITYMGYHWLEIVGDTVTIGINETGLEEFDSIKAIDLPAEGTTVAADEVCGELDTDQGPLNLYSPVDGQVSEVNDGVISEPGLIAEDCYSEGWLFKIVAENPEDLDELASGSTNDDD